MHPFSFQIVFFNYMILVALERIAPLLKQFKSQNYSFNATKNKKMFDIFKKYRTFVVVFTLINKR